MIDIIRRSCVIETMPFIQLGQVISCILVVLHPVSWKSGCFKNEHLMKAPEIKSQFRSSHNHSHFRIRRQFQGIRARFKQSGLSVTNEGESNIHVREFLKRPRIEF